jgi:23S rRNA (uridine2552-2'-O)-methyltransferase
LNGGESISGDDPYSHVGSAFEARKLSGRVDTTNQMSQRDEYYNRAKQQGYRARSAYKLKQLDETAGLFGDGNTVVDLGAAPGSWMQVAAERVGGRGTVVGVDRQRIDDLADPAAAVEYVRGDITEDSTKQDIRETVGGGEQPADVVVSDMAPNMTGEYELDHARSVHLAREAFEVALDLLGPGGDFAVKVFDGRDLADLEADVEGEFEYVRQIRPDASRDSSSELYLVGKNRLTAPVRTGDELAVEIDDIGDEGDGIAHVDGFTLFVSGVEEGDEVRVRVEDVKPNYGFAQQLQ